MSAAWPKSLGTVCLVGVACAAMVFLSGAAPNSGGKSTTKYEYKTVSSGMKSLPVQLNQLEKDGWYVVSIIRDFSGSNNV